MGGDSPSRHCLMLTNSEACERVSQSGKGGKFHKTITNNTSLLYEINWQVSAFALMSML